MPEQALPGTVTNSGQPLVATGGPASEVEESMAGRAALATGSISATGSPAVE